MPQNTAFFQKKSSLKDPTANSTLYVGAPLTMGSAGALSTSVSWIILTLQLESNIFTSLSWTSCTSRLFELTNFGFCKKK